MYSFTMIPSPLGKLTLVASQKNLVALYINELQMPLKDLAIRDDQQKVLLMAKKQLEEYFIGTRDHFDLPLKPQGTIFQVKAWNALCKIPFGTLWSYGKQAAYIKSPNGQRAVGGANGKNPIPIIIPCHRVIGSTGKLTGFSGGMGIKIYLLEHEGHDIDSENLKII